MIVFQIIGTIEDVNVSVMEFFSDIWLEHPILSHPLKVDCNYDEWDSGFLSFSLAFQ